MQTPLTANQVLTIGSSFFKKCPPENPRLIATPSPTLTISNAVPGRLAKLSFQIPKDSSNNGKLLFVAFLTGIKTLFAPLNDEREVMVPEGLIGMVYAVVTNDGSKVTDGTTVAGPAIVMIPYSSGAN